MTDPISDIITRIRNASAVHKESASIPYSKIKHAIIEVLQKEGYILSAQKKGKSPKLTLDINLAYTNGESKIKGIEQVSKFSKRVYLGVRDIKTVKQGRGMFILTTPKGLMSDEEARKQRLGGEVILKVW